MAVYPKFAPSVRNSNDIPSDVYAIESMKASLARRPTPQISLGEDQYKHLRKTSPANIPLRRTLEWVEALPPRVRPMALLRQFARVANLIAATWGDVEAFETYIESLLTDKRGNRKGFPPEIVEELSALEVYRLAVERRDPPWMGVKKRVTLHKASIR